MNGREYVHIKLGNFSNSRETYIITLKIPWIYFKMGYVLTAVTGMCSEKEIQG